MLAGAAKSLLGEDCAASPLVFFTFYAFGPSATVRLERLPALATNSPQTTVLVRACPPHC